MKNISPSCPLLEDTLTAVLDEFDEPPLVIPKWVNGKKSEFVLKRA